MIDLHCHILPGLDDGPQSLEDSVEMARQAEEDGIVAVCATPHIRSDHNVSPEEIGLHVDTLNRALARRQMAVRVLPGGEVAAAEAERLTDAQLGDVTLGDGRWVLLEPAPGPLDVEIVHVAELMAKRGFGTIVAHPERHAGTCFTEHLKALSAVGCLIQWTAAFVADAAAGDLVLSLAGEGLVHLLASDSHSAFAGRPLRISAGFERLAAVCNRAQIEWMAETAPQAIVRGTPISPRP